MNEKPSVPFEEITRERERERERGERRDSE